MKIRTLKTAEQYSGNNGDMIIPNDMSLEDIFTELLEMGDGNVVDTTVRRILDARDYGNAPLGREIYDECQEIAHFLGAKNRAYGNSAGDPIGIFAKRLDTLAQIDVRIDDKLNRLSKGSEYPGDDTVLDLVGYLVLRNIIKKKEEAGASQ